jgi:hypothetical protein
MPGCAAQGGAPALQGRQRRAARSAAPQAQQPLPPRAPAATAHSHPPRARAQEADVVGDLVERRGQGVERAAGVHHRVVRSQRLELVGRGDERQAGVRGHLRRDLGVVADARIEAGAHGSAALRQLVQPGGRVQGGAGVQRGGQTAAAGLRARGPERGSPGRCCAALRGLSTRGRPAGRLAGWQASPTPRSPGQRLLYALDAVLHLGGVAAELLAQRQRRGVLRVRAPDLDDV